MRHIAHNPGSLFIVMLLVLMLAPVQSASAQYPPVLTYQGFLTDEEGEPMTVESATLTFRLYDAVAGGSTLWTETLQNVSIADGLLTVILGESEALNPALFDQPIWISIALGDATTPEMSPRTPMTSVPHSLRARSLDEGALEAGDNVVISRNGNALRIAVPEIGEGEIGWGVFGNTDTDPDSNFIGTRDERALALRVNNRRVLRIEPAEGSPNIIGGFEGNIVEGDVRGATVGGGGTADDGFGNEQHHTVSGNFATIGGGAAHTILGNYGTIGGGLKNSANLNDQATIGGGSNNVARGSGSTIAGGRGNFIDGLGADAVVGGGRNNRAGRFYATVPGGQDNAATANHSFAAGRRAKANHTGAFVWGDATDQNIASTADNQFLIRAAGGVGIGTSAPTSPLTVAGIVESVAGGFRFPDGTVQTSAAAGTDPAWNLGGNQNTVPGTDFVGTVDEVALEFRVRNVRALRIEPINPTGTGRVAAGSANIIGGHRLNVVRGGAVGVTIGGGGRAGGGGGTFVNIATEDYATIGGGRGNFAGDDDENPESALFPTIAGGSGNRATSFAATVGGGSGNTANGNQHATVAGGGNNTAGGNQSTVGGGVSNEALSSGATVGGGFRNKAIGGRSTVPGGDQNEARGQTAFAAGYRARAIHDGAFVWSDRSRTSDSLLSTQAHQFTAKASGGVIFYSNTTATTGVRLTSGSGAWSSLSDRNLKAGFEDVDPLEVLRRVAAVPVWTWRYRDEEAGIRHMGPTAQDFYAAFGLGPDDRHITTVDADGVLFAAVQGLLQLLQDQQHELAVVKEEVAALNKAVEALTRRIGGFEHASAGVAPQE